MKKKNKAVRSSISLGIHLCDFNLGVTVRSRVPYRVCGGCGVVYEFCGVSCVTAYGFWTPFVGFFFTSLKKNLRTKGENKRKHGTPSACPARSRFVCTDSSDEAFGTGPPVFSPAQRSTILRSQGINLCVCIPRSPRWLGRWSACLSK